MTNVPAPYETQMQLPIGNKSFSNALKSFFHQARNSTFTPTSDLYETSKGYELYIYLPGVKKEDISLEVIGRTLYLTGEKKSHQEEGRTKHWSESGYGKFERQFDFPQKADLEKIEAELDSGILLVYIPKNEEKAQYQKIDVK